MSDCGKVAQQHNSSSQHCVTMKISESVPSFSYYFTLEWLLLGKLVATYNVYTVLSFVRFIEKKTT